MSNGEHNLDKYFPAGSAELNSVQHRVRDMMQNGTYTDDTLIFSKREFNTAMAKMETKTKLYFLYGLIVGLVGILVTILTRFY